MIPCKRPRVVVVHDGHKDVHGAHCQVRGCSWKYGPGVKTDVEQQAVRHRQAHRAAVPKTEVLRLTGVGWKSTCECGWSAAVGVVARNENDLYLTYHLERDHGLVSCP